MTENLEDIADTDAQIGLIALSYGALGGLIGGIAYSTFKSPTVATISGGVGTGLIAWGIKKFYDAYKRTEKISIQKKARQ